MIYAVILTQILTVIVLLIVAHWSISYVRERDEAERKFTQVTLQELATTSEVFGRFVESHTLQASREREQLLERIQHPVTSAGQAAATGGEGPSIKVVTDEEEWAADFPEVAEREANGEQLLMPVMPFRTRGAKDGE